MGYLKRLTIRNFVSPYGLALFSYAVFLFAWIFPPNIYIRYVVEPDLMFLDPLTLIFYTSCVVAFLFGVRSARYLGLAKKDSLARSISVAMPLVYLAIPLLLVTAFCTVYLILLGGKINFVTLLIAQQGQTMKMASEAGETTVEGRWGSSLTMLTAVILWASYRMNQVKMRGMTKYIFLSILTLAIAINVLTCIAMVSRGLLMPLIVGLAFLYFYRQSRTENVRLTRLAVTWGASVSLVIAIFILLSFLRGASALNLLTASVLGYSIAPYNRMAVLLNGVMTYTYGGRGIYLFAYLQKDGTKVVRMLDLHARLGWPTSLQLWHSEFSSVAAAGLSPAYIWSGVFGYLYSDIGWWTLMYLAIVGIMVGHLWSKFQAGHTVALVLYPFVGYWITFWSGYNQLFSIEFVATAECGILLMLYEAVWTRAPNATKAT